MRPRVFCAILHYFCPNEKGQSKSFVEKLEIIGHNRQVLRKKVQIVLAI